MPDYSFPRIIEKDLPKAESQAEITHVRVVTDNLHSKDIEISKFTLSEAQITGLTEDLAELDAATDLVQTNLETEILERTNADSLKANISDMKKGYLFAGIATTSTVPPTYGVNDRVYYSIDCPASATTLTLANFGGLVIPILTVPTRYSLRWGGTSWSGVIDGSKLNTADVDIYNVTEKIPLSAGLYYTPTTARIAVPNGFRKLGMKITYATAPLQEIYRLTIFSTPISSGNAIIVFDGAAFTVALNASTETTLALVAAKIASIIPSGWTVAYTIGNPYIDYTKTITGYCKTPMLITSSTGLKATISVTQFGSNRDWVTDQFFGTNVSDWGTASNWGGKNAQTTGASTMDVMSQNAVTTLFSEYTNLICSKKGYVNPSGAVVYGSATWRVSDYLPVGQLDMRKISLIAESGTANSISFYDSSYNYLGGSGANIISTSQYDTLLFQYPNAYYVIFCRKVINQDILIIGLPRIEDLGEEVKSLWVNVSELMEANLPVFLPIQPFSQMTQFAYNTFARAWGNFSDKVGYVKGVTIKASQSAVMDIYRVHLGDTYSGNNFGELILSVTPSSSEPTYYEFDNIIKVDANYQIIATNIAFISGSNSNVHPFITTADGTTIIKRINPLPLNGLYYEYAISLHFINNDAAIVYDQQLNKQVVPVILPPAIYTVCNDIKSGVFDDILNSRQYSVNVRLDHLFHKITSKLNVSVNGKGSHSIILDSILNAPGVSGYNMQINSDTIWESQDINNKDISFVLKGDNIEDVSCNFKHISVRNKLTENKNVRILCIGDSVTAGSYGQLNKPYPTAPESYFEWIKTYFELDKIENGDSGYECVMLGNKLVSAALGEQTRKSFDINLNGLVKNSIKASACGMSGATTQTWLGSGSVFYNPATSEFSIAYWVDSYRTLLVNVDESLTRCDNSNKGTLAPSDTTLYDVCEPTHIIIQLGYNQAYNADGGTRTAYLADLNTMITTIRTEYPSVKILLSLPDTCGTYFPADFPKYDIDNTYPYPLDLTFGDCKAWHDKFAFMNEDLMALENQANNVYYVPSYFVGLACEQTPYRVSNFANHLSDTEEKSQHRTTIGWIPYQHPNNAGHAVIGHQIYSLIKWTLVTG